MDVLQEILEWSEDRPSWQRDALRRLVLNGDLSDDDIEELTEICKASHGLGEQGAANPLTKQNVPVDSYASGPVSLLSIFHHRGVNALAESQTLGFSPHLTVVYGDNAAGKTGYIRILKGACRARGREQILGNVISGATPLSPAVSIKFSVGTEPKPREWTGEGGDDFISRVSVFDTQCAAVYLTEKTDVAFRPFGLDLFDKLVQACKAVRTKLENERRNLEPDSALIAVQTQIPDDTAAAKLLRNISSLTKPETVEALTHLSSEEDARLALLEKSLRDLQANDPAKLAQALSLRAGRVSGLTRHLQKIEVVLSSDAVADVIAIQAEARRKSREAKRLREATFPAGVLAGTGSELWTALWQVARRFSEDSAYPGKDFPVVESSAHCVLCQQAYDEAAANRMKQFAAFVASTTENELREIRDAYALRKGAFDLQLLSDTVEDSIKELRLEDEVLAEAVSAALLVNEQRRKAIVSAQAEENRLSTDYPDLVSTASKVAGLANQIEERVTALRQDTTGETRKQMITEARELNARMLLAKHEQFVLNEIERRKQYAAYGLCIDETKTQTITQKSTTVTKSAVSEKLKRSFRDELKALAFRHVEVELKEAGGADGVLYHKLALTRAPGVELPRVVSEGEQRCLSIAAFFAELSTADDPSGIVFDDPVSSLDYRWREGVAQRLVQESKSRQVIVFTHDVVFLLLLKQYAEQLKVDHAHQHIRQGSKGAGICEEELPWVALPVKKKIGHLKSEWQTADKLFRDGQQATYEKEAKYLYGLLREAWERALEEVLLAGVVERYRPGVQTQHVATIADITPADCQTLHTAMTKSSKWLPGHDQAAAARAAVPEPAELKSDIEVLEQWIAAIRKRRP